MSCTLPHPHTRSHLACQVLVQVHKLARDLVLRLAAAPGPAAAPHTVHTKHGQEAGAHAVPAAAHARARGSGGAARGGGGSGAHTCCVSVLQGGQDLYLWGGGSQSVCGDVWGPGGGGGAAR